MKTVYVFLIACAVSACGADSNTKLDRSSSNVAQADTLYTNGVIWTGVSSAPDATVMAITGGTISYIGYEENLPISAMETVDLKGGFVMPGFIDNHVHFLEGGAALASVDLRDATTPEMFSTRIVDYAKTRPKGRWVLNGNWDHELWGGELPRKDWIDKETPETPVFVVRLDGHMALANSAALQIAGISSATIAPNGGEIVTDESGKPTGIIKGNALDLVLSVIPQPSDGEVLETFSLAQSHALALGLTQVHAVTANETETTMLDAFRLAEKHGVLKIRVFVSTPIGQWKSTRDLVKEIGTGNGRLRWGGIKGFVDGSLGSTTAWFHEAYADAPDTSGSPLVDPANLKSMLNDADQAGLRLSIHAIGDKAIDALLADLREIAGVDVASRRYRIEHFQHPSRGAIQTMAESGIIASMQPYHAIDDGRWAEHRIGAKRIKTTYAFRSLLNAGVHLTFGSDWPVAPLSPLEGVYAAVTRRTTDGANPDGWQPQEKITVEEALTAYTVTNAYANFEEELGGTLEKGKRADFVVLAMDPRAVDPAEIRNIRVLATVIDGEVVFSSPLPAVGEQAVSTEPLP